MSTLGTSIEIGRNALKAHQIGIAVTGDNIANVNTPGFSRKKAKLQTTPPVGGFGTGVQVTKVTRARDQLIDAQVRFENGLFGRLESMQRSFTTIEAVFSELAGSSAGEAGAVFSQSSGVGLSGSMSRFFNGFQDLANNPESGAARSVIREEGQLLTRTFNRLDRQLRDLRTELEAEFQRKVDEANTLLEEIARLNVRIPSERLAGGGAGGALEDTRDNLVDELSNLVDITVREEANGSLKVLAAEGSPWWTALR